MTSLPKHGRIRCTLCHDEQEPVFDRTKTQGESWRITYNPLSWGDAEPEIVVLGFSKGQTQAGGLANSPHDAIAYKGSRLNVGKILSHVGLIPAGEAAEIKNSVDRLIADRAGRFHFGSLIRCTVERFDQRSDTWKGSGGGMLDKFVATPFGKDVANNCANRFLSQLPDSTKLLVMFGLGTRLNYVSEAKKLISRARPGHWRWHNEVSYTDGNLTVVHVEHFASQGALIPNWLGENQHPRSEYGRLAQTAVIRAIGAQQYAAPAS